MDSSAFNNIISLQKARWRVPDVSLSEIEQIARGFDLPEAVARLLCTRGIKKDEVQTFIAPTLKEHFPDPFSLKDMEAAATFLAQAVQDKKNIAIFGDFDVDGATSSALLYRTLKAVGIDAPIYIPDRLTEGYGPNVDAFQTLKDKGVEIIIILDCGTTAFDTIAAGREMGLDIVIVDHHEAEDKLPASNYLINPKRKDDQSGLTMLAAVGVTFMLCVALNNKLRAAGFYKENGIDEPPLKDWLDIVALGTVCDMVPLTHVNRLLVRQGMKVSEKTSNTGLKALMDVAGVQPPFNTYHAGFILGPRINAGSRVHKSNLGAVLLSTDDAAQARDIAFTLNDCNDKRKALQKGMEDKAFQTIEAQGLDQNPVILVEDEEGHTGLSGLVAGQIKEKYQKPACIIVPVENEKGEMEGRGSGRSIPGIHIAQAFIDARTAGLLMNGGGHAMAGGFSLQQENIEAFKQFMLEHITRQMENVDPNIETIIDGVLTVRGASVSLIKMLQEYIGPFGQENAEPIFALQNVRIISADVVGDAHIRTMISDWEGGPRMKAMAFRAVGTPLGDALLKHTTQAFHIAGTFKVDSWTGQERAEMHIKDACFAASYNQQAAAI